MSDGLPDGLISFGSDANCTLEICPLESSILTYKPATAASVVFIAIFGASMFLHFFQGLKYRHTLGGYAIPVMLGCIDEIIGYIGRIILHNNPFSFNGFIIQIVCITTSPVFICAAIYVCLARTITHLDPSLARFKPKFLIWFFIPCDVISLVFQAVGGALSATDDSDSSTGVNISLFGLAFQVFTLVIFCALFIDYLVRFYRQRRSAKKASQSGTGTTQSRRLHIFLSFLGLAILLILIRCCYRIDELSEGYSGELMHNEGLFIALESAMISAAVLCLHVSQPGWGLGNTATADAQRLNSGGVFEGHGGSRQGMVGSSDNSVELKAMPV